MLDEKGFKRKRFAEIFSELEAKAREAFGEKVNTSERSPLGIILRLFAWGLSLLWQQLENVYNSAYVDTASGNTLGYVGKYIGIKKRLKEKAKGVITVTGDPGRTIPKGQRVKTKKNIMFETQKDALIGADGHIDIPIVAVVAGSSGNVPAGEITDLVNPLTFQITITNAAKTEGGRENETDTEFRDRYDRSLATGGSSTTESIEATLLALTGVLDCTVDENTTLATVNGIPPKSVAPLVLGGDDQVIATAIFKTKSGGVRSFGDNEVTVVDSKGNEHVIGFSRPTITDIYVSVTLTTDSDFPTNGYDLVRAEIIKYIGGGDQDGAEYNGLGLGKKGAGQKVVYTKIISAIQQVPGITDMDLRIGIDPENMGTSNVITPAKSVPKTSWEKVTVS
ncbi:MULTISPECIES: baseplate J/gp47 family protein [Brevibacillus]|uniref:baseplate J/gp47 family protein n=1 Tax=Brevibacillus TaxID=55080 RepID=UPI0026303071|nr:baseplate J/gp47 family protein [Brevibacillus nitrificans]